MYPVSLKDALAKSFAHEELHSIRHIDHVTYAGRADDEINFVKKWGLLGFDELVRLKTIRFPATHIALTSGETPQFPWATMTGLSTSEDMSSPINEFVVRYGEGIQHVAYNIHPEADMEILLRELKKLHWNFMTPVLVHEDENHARLRQMFTAPESPSGTFVEFVQRLPGPDGATFNSFDIDNIDDLYQYYAEYSAWLTKKDNLTVKKSILIPQGMEAKSKNTKGLHG